MCAPSVHFLVIHLWLKVCSWFELDQDEVLNLKGRLLEAAGASKVHGQQAKHPLRAGSYASAVANLTDTSWPKTLAQMGG